MKEEKLIALILVILFVMGVVIFVSYITDKQAKERDCLFP